MSILHIIDLVVVAALAASGVASVVFLYLYHRIHGSQWRRMDSAWIYIVSLNSLITVVAATTLILFFWPAWLAVEIVRAGSLVAFAGVVAYQVYMLYQRP